MANVTRANAPVATGWVGWIAFASFMMMMSGTFQFIAGLSALIKDEFFLVTQKQLLIFDITTWGWIHLLFGIVIFFAGLSLLSGNILGRTIGVTLAFLSAVANLTSISTYPLWSIIIITVDILVIYALTVHGREMKV